MLRNRLFLLCAFIISVVLIWNCSSDSSNPTGPGDGDNSDATALETKTQDIGTSGGTITLSGGTIVMFPAGAVDESVTYTVRNIEPSGYSEPDAVIGRIVIECTGSVTTFDKPVEIIVPLPEDMTAADSLKVFGGYIDEESGTKEMQPCTIRMIDGKPYGVLALSHFSTGFMDWLLGETPPASAGPLNVPYYGQGESTYCWAVSLQMVTQAAGFETRNEITDIIGDMGVDEDGISSIGFRTNGTISSIVKSRTGVTPDRCTWDGVNYRNMKDYLKQEIGVRGYPVAVHSTVWNHAVVIVGYDGNTFYIHDPASTSTSAVGYTARSWSDMVKGMGAGQFMVCLTVPKAIPASTPSLTVNVMNNAIQFNRPATKEDPSSRIYKYVYDYKNEDGYSFQDIKDQKSVTLLPCEINTLKQGGDIEIVNSSRTAAKEVSIWLEVICLDVKGVKYEENYRFSLSANSTKRFTFDDIPVDEFRWNAESASRYSFIVRGLDGGSFVDEQSIQFQIDSRPVEITSMSPDRGGPGTEVTLRGSGFGSIPKFTTVKFNGVEAEVDTASWSNDSIKVIVPEKATTGEVTVKNGDVTGKAGTFTVTKQTTETQSFSYQTDSSFGELVMSANASVTLSAEIIESWIEASTNYYIYDVKTGEQASLSISGNASLDTYSKTTIQNDITTVVTYHEPKMTALSDTEYENWPMNISGDFAYSASENSVAFTFDNLDDRLSVNIVYVVTCDIRRYDSEGALIDESLDQLYNSRTIGVVSISAW